MNSLLPPQEVEDEQERCYHSMCAMLPLGFVLLAWDLYHDLGWCLWPNPKTRQALIRYYTVLLTPQVMYLYPGYWFPVYAIFKFCYQCSDVYNWILLALFVPVAWRYRGILSGRDVELKNWWFVVGIRFALIVVNYLDHSNRGCVWSKYPDNAQHFLIGETR